MPGDFFRGQGQRLPFIRAHIGAHKEAGRPGGGPRRSERFAVPSHEGVVHLHGKIELSGGKNVAAHRARRRAAPPHDFAFQDGVRVGFIRNPISAVLLQLFNDCARDQHLDARHEGAVAEGGDRERMNLAQSRRLGGSEMVTGAPTEKNREQQRKLFHYGGVGAASGVLSGAAEGAGAGVASSVEEGGAVVVSGRSEAGGGNDRSMSGAGSGASGAFDGVFPSGEGFFFLFAAAAVTAGDCSLASPNLARSSATLFFARSPSGELGCWRITSL